MTLTLPQLLTDNRLNGTVLDLMAGYIQTEVAYDGPTGVCVCGMIFPNKIAQLWETETQPPDWFQERFIDPVRGNQCRILYFPMFWPKHKRWVSIRINFTTGIVSIGQ